MDLAFAQAQQLSLRDSFKNSKKKAEDDEDDDRKMPAAFESFRNLDDATALAIKNSLDEKDRGLFERYVAVSLLLYR